MFVRWYQLLIAGLGFEEAVIACGLLAQAVNNIQPKLVEHSGISSPSIDSGGFRAPDSLVLTFDP